MARSKIYSADQASLRNTYSKLVNAVRAQYQKLEERAPGSVSLSRYDPQRDFLGLKALKDTSKGELEREIGRLKSVKKQLSIRRATRTRETAKETLKSTFNVELNDDEFRAFTTMMDEMRDTMRGSLMDSDRVAQIAKEAVAAGCQTKSEFREYFNQWRVDHTL